MLVVNSTITARGGIGADGNAVLEVGNGTRLGGLSRRVAAADAVKHKTHAKAVPEGLAGTVSAENAQPKLAAKAKKAKKDSERGHRLPENWQPDDALVQWAEHTFPQVGVLKEIQNFCDYWDSKPGKDGRKTN